MTLLRWISWANRGKSQGREFSSRLPTGSLANRAPHEVCRLWTSLTGVWPAPWQDLPEAACCRKRRDAPHEGLLAFGIMEELTWARCWVGFGCGRYLLVFTAGPNVLPQAAANGTFLLTRNELCYRTTLLGLGQYKNRLWAGTIIVGKRQWAHV